MRGSIPFGRVLGIRLRLHITFVVLLAWVAWAGTADSGWRAGLWTTATLVLAFGCILLHELGHCVVAMHYGVRVSSITLLPIGGVASMSHIPERPSQEFLVAIAGPLVNVAIAGLLVGFAGAEPGMEGAGALPSGAAECLSLLATANIVLVVFNLVPAFPMDGGRMLRSLLAVSMPYVDATRVASELGRIIALVFVVVGWVFQPLLPVIGVFVFWGAGLEARVVHVRAALGGKSVGDLMRVPAAAVGPEDGLDRCAAMMAETGQADFPVVDGEGRLVGLLTRARWQPSLRRARRPGRTVRQCMLKRFASVHEDSEALRLFQDLARLKQNVFPVVREGRVAGLVYRDDLLRAAQEHDRRGWLMHVD